MYVVIGGCGHIGSHLCNKLAEEGLNVLAIDDLSFGKKERLNKSVNFIEKTAADLSKDDFPKDTKYVFHLGEYARVEQSHADIDLVFEANFGPLYRILCICSDINAKLIYAGSSTKFGDDGAAKDGSPYAWTKSVNSDLVAKYANWKALNYAIVYFYNVYGGNENSKGQYATVIAKFLEAKRTGKSVHITSPGTQSRNFTHIDDTIAALLLVGKEGAGDYYGIGSDKAYNIIELANLMELEYEIIANRAGNRIFAPVHNQKTKALGWVEKHNLEDHIRAHLCNFK